MYSILKPSTATRYAAPSFDPHAFAGDRPRPVSPITGISWEDYARMGTFQHKQRAERRLPAPIWARDNTKLLSLLVRFLERRSQLRTGAGTAAERLVRAEAARRRQIPAMERVLRRLCKRYCRRRSAKARRRLAVQIQNYDASICLIRKGEAAAILRAIFLYYRTELDSVGVAAETGISPPNCRQIFWKLNKLWESEFASAAPASRNSASISSWEDYQKLLALAPPSSFCGYCKTKPALEGRTRCQVCTDRNRAKAEARRLRATAA